MSRHFAEIPQDAWYSGQDLSNSSDNAAWFPGITSQTLAPEPYSTGTQPGIDPEDTSFVEDAKFGEEQDVHGNPAEPMTSAVLIDPNLDYDHLPGEFSDLHRADVTSSEFQFLMNSDSEPRFPELNYQEYQPGNQRMPLYKPAHSESAEWNTTNVPYSLPPPRMDRSAQDHQRGLELDNPDSYGRETGAGQLSLRSLPGIGYVSDSTANGNIYFGNLLSPGPAPSRGSSSRFWPSSYHESDQSFLQNPPDRLQASYDTLAFPLLEDSGPASQVFKPERAAEVFEFDSGRSLPIDSFSAAHAHRRQIKHRVTNSLVPHEVDTRPDIYIKQLHSAMMDMDDAKDGQRKTVTGVDKRPSQGYVKLSKDPNYETDAWAASWMVLVRYNMLKLPFNANLITGKVDILASRGLFIARVAPQERQGRRTKR